jgi:cysteine-rich repeat protein
VSPRASDALAILRASVGSLTNCGPEPCKCDVNASGAITVTDAFVVLRVSAGIGSMPVCDCDPALPFCGDGFLSGTETCDHGSDNGSAPDGCRHDCTTARCGDGVVDSDEECDNGEDVENDDCSPQCLFVENCGDGVVSNGEQCDDGLGTGYQPDLCRPNCRLPYCGDGITDSVYGEDCDDANTDPYDFCDTSCYAGIECGDGIRHPFESCDDGPDNAYEPDACRPTCVLPVCGDSITDPANSEECDDRNAMNDDACSNDCTLN